jgi:uncharacterized sulfatase
MPWLRGAAFWLLFLSLTTGAVGFLAAADRPNILWLTSEDNGPHIGAFGDTYATTPNLDALASRGLSYFNCWSTAPVCAPARTTIISGVYPPSTGSQHMRSETRLPAFMKMYPQFLREAGYYCTNNSKEDYNLTKPGKVWDDSSRQAHWKNRPEGKPFFAIFNFTVTHESQIRRRPHDAVHDPSGVRVPAYHPDTPEVRQDWAQYHDKMTEMDAMIGDALAELEEAGLQDDTIIFYYGDHGPGMPRSKRWPYNSGLNVPLIVHVPEKYSHLAPGDYIEGARTDRLVGFIDLAPTLLSLAGIKPPSYMQGHAFMGPFEEIERNYLHGFRGRMDERYDMVRTVRDKRFIYIRNYMPHKPYGQHVSYMFQTPTTRVWKKLYDEGALNSAQSHFWEPKPPEELYDLTVDPDEVNNLAGNPAYDSVLNRFRSIQRHQVFRIRDTGFLPESHIHHRGNGAEDTPYEMAHNSRLYPLDRIFAMADLASSMKEGATPDLIAGLSDSDAAVRYWAAMGLLMRGPNAVFTGRPELHQALNDADPSVRVIAAEALVTHGPDRDLDPCLKVLIEAADYRNTDVYVANLAMNVIDQMDQKAVSLLPELRRIPVEITGYPGRASSYVSRLVQTTLDDLGVE